MLGGQYCEGDRQRALTTIKKKVKRIKKKSSQKKTSNGRRIAETATHTVVSRRRTAGKTQSGVYC